MLRFFLLYFLVVTTTAIHSQSLADTNWKTEINGTTYTLEFLTDSLNLFIGIEKIELSAYQTRQDTLILMDHEGANCIEEGLYQFDISNDTLLLSVINDDCSNRRNFLDELTLTKCIISATESTPDLSEYVIYPNPSYDGVFKIKAYKNSAILKLYDLTGNSIDLIFSDGHIDLSALPKSIYFLEIISGEYRIKRTLISQ